MSSWLSYFLGDFCWVPSNYLIYSCLHPIIMNRYFAPSMQALAAQSRRYFKQFTYARANRIIVWKKRAPNTDEFFSISVWLQAAIRHWVRRTPLAGDPEIYRKRNTISSAANAPVYIDLRALRFQFLALPENVIVPNLEWYVGCRDQLDDTR